MWLITLYKKENGESPVKEFINDINDYKLQAKIVRDIELLKEFGNKLPSLYSKKITNGKSALYELRSKQSTNITRIIYYFRRNREIILLKGFIKKSDKTPTNEIETANKYRDDWEKRIK